MLEIGTTRGGKRVELTDRERARHIHIIGAIGTGKSKLLEHMIRQDIARGRGLCLIDPHGTLADKVEAWCAARNLGNVRNIHLVRPGDDELVPGFNPLRIVPGEALSVRVDAMVGACAQVWGVRDMSATPRLEKILWALFYALAVRGLTLAEGPALLRAQDPEGLRRTITEGLPDPICQITWDELNGMPRREFAEHVESAHTRLSKFLMAPAMRLVVGQRNHSIDFRAAMDSSETVLVNLGARNAFSYRDARVLGTMLINDMFLTALGRDEKTAERHPFTLYIDEAYDFLSGDIEMILDQTRKFGLHAVLAHQRIGQLKDRGEGVYNAVMGGTQTKIVLGGLSDDDAGIMAREIMRGDIDLERPKRGITMPVVVGEESFWLESESSTDGTSRARATAHGTSVAQTSSESISENPDEYDGRAIATSGSSSSIVENFSASESFGTNSSVTRGRAQAQRSIREERPTQFYSLEESLHLAQLKLRNLPDRAAIVKRRGQRTVRVETVEVKPLLKLPATASRFRKLVSDKSKYVVGIAIAEAEVHTRQANLGQRRPHEEAAADGDFWQEE
jgi:Type IV secretion-system coupling protein DNA-binding domain